MPSHLRGMARAAGFVTWTLAVGGAWLCARSLSILGGLPRAHRLRGGAWTLSLWSRGLCVLLGLRVDARGAIPMAGSPAPGTGPRLLVSNHIGYLDVIILASIAPSQFVSKDDLARWPVLGPLARSVGTLFLERARPRAVAEVGLQMGQVFEAGTSVILFPEGTTTRGETVGPFHTALIEPALRARSGARAAARTEVQAQVQGVALAYASRSGEDDPDLAAWVGDASFLPHLYRLFCSEGVDVSVRFQESFESNLLGPDRNDVAPDRRAVAASIRDWMLDAVTTPRWRAAGSTHPEFQPRSVPGCTT